MKDIVVEEIYPFVTSSFPFLASLFVSHPFCPLPSFQRIILPNCADHLCLFLNPGYGSGPCVSVLSGSGQVQLCGSVWVTVDDTECCN